MPGRAHSREFKLTVVRQVVSGEKRPAQICREHNLDEGVLLRWRKEYDARGEAAFTPREGTEPTGLEQRVAELERFCGQLALENAALRSPMSSLHMRGHENAGRAILPARSCAQAGRFCGAASPTKKLAEGVRPGCGVVAAPPGAST
jgi:transposase-like protein